MSTTRDIRVDQLAAMSESVVELRSLLRRTESVRDQLIREMRAEGYSAINLAKITGLVRPRIYVILDGPGPDADDDDQLAFAEHVDEVWQHAVDHWLEANDEGKTPDDFFPLDALLERR